MLTASDGVGGDGDGGEGGTLADAIWLFEISAFLPFATLCKLARSSTHMQTLFAKEVQRLGVFVLVARSEMLSNEAAWQLRLLSVSIDDATQAEVDLYYFPNIFYCTMCKIRSKVPKNADILDYVVTCDEDTVMICHGRDGDCLGRNEDWEREELGYFMCDSDDDPDDGAGRMHRSFCHCGRNPHPRDREETLCSITRD